MRERKKREVDEMWCRSNKYPLGIYHHTTTPGTMECGCTCCTTTTASSWGDEANGFSLEKAMHGGIAHRHFWQSIIFHMRGDLTRLPYNLFLHELMLCRNDDYRHKAEYFFLNPLSLYTSRRIRFENVFEKCAF